jgi:serine protease Do
MKKIYKIILPLFVITVLVAFGFQSGFFVKVYNTIHNDVCTIVNTDTNYPSLINNISANAIKANVTVITTSYNTEFELQLGLYSSKQGSGVIYKEDTQYYYVLSNNHVVAKESGYRRFKLDVVDYLGNEYSALLIKNSADYDLSILRFAKSSTTLVVLEFEKENPKTNDEVFALGQPHNQRNTITIGKVLGYNSHQLKDNVDSTVNFGVLEHSAPMSSGNSGGVLLNVKLKIIGINYASVLDKNGGYMYGLAIPITKVIEFIG